MGIFSSIKKLFFVTESVAKSSIEKSTDYVKEQASEFADKAKEVIKDKSESVAESTAGLREAISKKAEEGFESAKDFAADISSKAKEVAAAIDEKFDKTIDDLSKNENVQKAADFTEKVGARVLEEGSKIVDKVQDFAENVGEKVLSSSDKLSDSSVDFGDKLSKGLSKAKEEIVEKAKVAAEAVSNKYDELTEKAMKAAEEDAKIPKKDFSDETLNTGTSLLEGKDDFFSKAAQYASGKYDAFSDKAQEFVEPIKAKVEDFLAPIDLPSDTEIVNEVHEIKDDVISEVKEGIESSEEDTSEEDNNKDVE